MKSTVDISVQFGSKQIDFSLVYSERKSLGITVFPDKSVTVKAPYDASIDKIKEKVKAKAPWILKQQNFFLSFEPRKAENTYVSGESILYLGRQYRLNITEIGKKESEQVKLRGQFLEVFVHDKKRTKQLVKVWYQQKATIRLKEIAIPLIASFCQRHQLEVSQVKLILRDMKVRWGSCTSKGKIILNPILIKAPKGCIEYVIVHELCHLIHYNHSQKFIHLQEKEMPDWKKWKMILEKLLA